MYDICYDGFSHSLDPGTNVLVTGPPLCGKRRLGMQALAAGARQGEGAVVVTTRDTADRVRADYRKLRVGEGEDTPTLGVVDAVSETIGQSASADPYTAYTSSPSDTAALGTRFSEFVQSYYTDTGIERARVLVDSLSPLLVYSTLQGVFRFAHEFTSRVDSADALGLYTVTSTAHDDETVETLTQVFDGTIALTAEGSARIRLPGIDDRTVVP